MKTTNFSLPVQPWLLIAGAQVLLSTSALPQGTVTFDGYTTRTVMSYHEKGMWFQVAAPPPFPGPFEYMQFVDGNHYTQAPYNGTPYVVFQANYHNYVVLSQTNGWTFGLTSVDLADPFYLSATQSITVSLTGVRADNSIVTATFTTPVGGTTNFTTFQFSSDFLSGLTRVEIPSTVWAMDNVVFVNVVPEPSSESLALLGFLVFSGWAAHKGRRPRVPTPRGS